MGRKAKNKQAPVAPLPGNHTPSSSLGKRSKGKKKASSATNDKSALKSKGLAVRHAKDRAVAVQRVKKVDVVDEDDSDLDEALQPG
jgi:hypothetical protein